MSRDSLVKDSLVKDSTIKEKEREIVTLRTKFKMQRDRNVWINLHHLAYNVVTDPIGANYTKKLQYLLENLPIQGMTCAKCRTHYEEFMSKYPLKISEIVSNKANFSQFLLEYHNSVNRSIGKPEFSAKEAEKYYVENSRQILKQLTSTGLKCTLADFYLDEKAKIEDFFKELDNSIRHQMRLRIPDFK